MTALFDLEAATARLMRYLAIEGITGQEAKIADAVIEDLVAAGVPRDSIRFDDANQRIEPKTQTGNLIVTLPGTRPGPRLLFSTHLDTVPLCAGAVPRREGDKIVPSGATALGGDNRTGCAVLVSLVKTLFEHTLPHPPITLLFTVREESGLLGAREVRLEDLGNPAMGFNVDGKLASELIVGAVGQESWTVEIDGKAAHAGVAPERGISASLVAGLALADVHTNGWFGKVTKPDGIGTSNVGVLGGANGRAAGEATNVVTDYAYVRGESRSSDAAFATTITNAFRMAFENATAAVRNVDGESAKIRFTSHAAYPPFSLAEDSAVAKRAQVALESIGLAASFRRSNGGLDANWLVHKGIPTVTFGAGQHEIHTKSEYVDLREFAEGCQLAVAMATAHEDAP